MLLKELKESASKFHATDVSHDPDYVMVLVRSSNEDEDYHGVNVLLYPDGKVDASTADDIADKEWEEHKAEITKVAKASVKTVKEDDANDVEQRMLIKMEKEKQRLAKLKQTDPEAYKREMEKRKTSSKIPPVSTF